MNEESVKPVNWLLIVILTFSSGILNAVAFLLVVQRVLISIMTGNIVFAGLSLVHAPLVNPDPWVYLLPIIGFTAGGGLGALMYWRKRNEHGWTSAATGLMLVEIALLVLFSFINGFTPKLILDLLLSFAVGMQSLIARRLSVAGVSTVAVTVVLTEIGEAVLSKLRWHLQSKADRDDASKPKLPAFHLLTWLSVIAAYLAGAACSYLMIPHLHLQTVWVSIGLLVMVTLIGSSTLTSKKHSKSLKASAVA